MKDRLKVKEQGVGNSSTVCKVLSNSFTDNDCFTIVYNDDIEYN